jgi:peptidoglycan-associated lipoprotein
MHRVRLARLTALALVALCSACSASRAGKGPASDAAAEVAAPREPAVSTAESARVPPAAVCSADADCDGASYCDSGACVKGPRCEATIRFAYDESLLSSAARESLVAAADCVRSRGWASVRLEGHADERGTSEYNIHLGQRRAEAVQRYLKNLGLGVPMDAMSYGEEKPVATGEGEEAWAQNRRVELRRGQRDARALSTSSMR